MCSCLCLQYVASPFAAPFLYLTHVDLKGKVIHIF